LDTLEYNGEVYTRRNAKWVDSRNLVVYENLQKSLNHLYLEKLDYQDYKAKFKKQNNSLNGNVFEMILVCLFFQLDLLPLYTQTKLTYVPNINFDFLLFKKDDFLDDKGSVLYEGVIPICISLKTSQRERYKETDKVYEVKVSKK